MRNYWKRIVCCLFVMILLVSSFPASVSATGEWANVYIKQKTVDRWLGCTVCTLQLMLQNSDTLLSEWQMPPGVIPPSHYGAGDKYDKFNQACVGNIGCTETAYNKSGRVCPATGYDYSGKRHCCDDVVPSGMNSVSHLCKPGTNWKFLGGVSSVEGSSTNTAGSNFVVGIGGTDFKSMTYAQTVSAMKLFWNAGYWVAIGLVYNNNSSKLGPGPSGYTSNHWVMLAGVDDNDFYINDPYSGDCKTFKSHSTYDKVVHLALFKNDVNSPLSLSGGQRANLNTSDYGNLNDAGLSNSVIDSMNNTGVSLAFSDASFLSNCRLSEANLNDILDIVDVDNMLQNDLEVLEGWKTNISGNKKEFGFIAVLRWIVSFVGILITLWALLVYLAFWFDHINSFVYLDALHLVTLGALHICPPNEKPTFSLGKSVKDKTVSHGQILCICITAILFGAALISGVFYLAVTKLVNLITSFVWGS